MGYFRNMTIRTRFTTATLAVVVVVMSFFNILKLIGTIGMITDDLEAKLEATASLAALGLSEPLWVFSDEAIIGIADALFQDTEVVLVQVRTSFGEDVYLRTKPVPPELEAGVFRKTLPIVREGTTLGEVTLGVSNRLRMGQIRTEIQNAVYSTAAMALILLGSIAWISGMITRPLKALAQGTEAVAQGEYSRRLEVETWDEVGHLAQKFNAMAETLEQTMKALQEIREHLEEEVALRTAELVEAKARAEAASQSKSRFLANVSHELRTPLNAILGFSRMLLREGSLNPKQQADLDAINRSGDHLLKLINEVLEISRIESGRVSVVPSDFSLSGLLRDMETMFRPRAEEKGLTLFFSLSEALPAGILTDEGKLRQILINLLGNAIKYTGMGVVTVRVSAQTVPDDRSLLEFEVRDTGPGIPEEDQESIFEPFRQSEDGVRAGVGSGLGLTISRDFARMMGGELTLQSQLGKGSSFRLRLPVEVVPEPGMTPETQALEVVGRLEPVPQRVLVADDVFLNRLLLVRMLEPLELDIREASDGAETLELWKTWQPDLILLDIRMPQLGGYEVLERMRRECPEAAEKARVVAVTASAFDSDEKRALETVGMAGFIRKPVEMEELFHCLERVMGYRYRYREESPEGTGPCPMDLKACLNGLDAAMRDSLYNAASIADVEALTVLAEAMAREHPAPAAAIRHVAEQYRYDLLLEALKDGRD